MSHGVRDVFKNLSIQSGGTIQQSLATSFTTAKSHFKGIQGSQYATNGFNSGHDRYGWPEGQIPGTLFLQATDWSKRVKLTAVANNTSVIESVGMYLRVYRELSFRHYADKDTKRNYVLPNKPASVDSFVFSGSIGYPTGATWAAQGYYQIWWLVWEGSFGRRGALIDWSALGYYKGEADKNEFSGSPRLSGLSSFHSTSSDWQSPHGLKIYDEGDVDYYISDANEAPIKNTEVLRNAPIVYKSPAVVKGPSVIRYQATRTSPLPGTDATGISTAGSTEVSKYVWSHMETKVGGTWLPIALSYEDHERTKILIGQLVSPVQPKSLGGTQIVERGTGRNFVAPNIKFSTDVAKGAYNVWAPNPVKQNQTDYYIKPVVVDGASFAFQTPGSGPYVAGRDNTWIDASHTPSDYWYVLPTVNRIAVGACCKNSSSAPLINATPAINFNTLSPAATCTMGMHFGKFLKTAFSQDDLYEWLDFIEKAGKYTAAGAASTTQFSGWRKSAPGTSPNLTSPSYTPIQFSLAGLPEFPTISGAFNFSEGATSSSTSTTNAYDPVDVSIKDKLNVALNKKGVNLWTTTSIVEFAKTNAKALGKSLFDIKSELLELFYEAKIAWYIEEQNLSGPAAISKATNDPVYKSLFGFLSSTTPTGGGGGGGGSSGTPGSTPSKPKGSTTKGAEQAKNATKTIKITVTRGLPGYRPGIRQTAVTSDRPELVQYYEYLEVQPDGTTIGKATPRRFEFPFVPREVNYSGLGAQWTEIERTGNFPVVDWQSFQLLKISFNFDIVDRQLENQTGFGLYWSCEEQIRTLREMAQAPYPVTFLNMDQFMSEEVRYPLFTRGRGIEFVIAEFSVTSVQRTPAQAPSISGQLTANQISRATASMTLQEIPIEAIDIVQMPPIKPCNKKRKKCEDIPTDTTEQERTYVLFTPSVRRG